MMTMMTHPRVLRHRLLDLQVLRVLQARRTLLHIILERVLLTIQVAWSEIPLRYNDVIWIDVMMMSFIVFIDQWKDKEQGPFRHMAGKIKNTFMWRRVSMLQKPCNYVIIQIITHLYYLTHTVWLIHPREVRITIIT